MMFKQLESVHTAEHGVVHRHHSRGVDEEGAHELRRKEDDVCTAGLRTAADFENISEVAVLDEGHCCHTSSSAGPAC